MTTRCQVSLDGTSLADVDPSIIVTDVVESEPPMHLAAARHAAGDGQAILRRSRDSLSVTVRFLIREYSLPRRSAVLSSIHRWARGTALTVGHRPGQVLHGMANVLPTLASVQKWTGELSLTFTAHAFPYWRSTEPAVKTIAEGTMLVEGTAPAAPADVSLTLPAGVSALTVQTGDCAITLENLSLAEGSPIAFTHDENGVLRIASGETSLLHCRTADSSDDLLAVPGQENALRCSAGEPLEATFSIKGVWA